MALSSRKRVLGSVVLRHGQKYNNDISHPKSHKAKLDVWNSLKMAWLYRRGIPEKYIYSNTNFFVMIKRCEFIRTWKNSIKLTVNNLITKDTMINKLHRY